MNGHVRLFAGTEPAHLFVSEDLGLNWRELPALRSVPSVPKWSFPAPPHVGHVKHINFDADNPNTIYASVEVGGLLRSTDGGESWEEFPGLYEDVHRLMVHPADTIFTRGHRPRPVHRAGTRRALGAMDPERRRNRRLPRRLGLPSERCETAFHDRRPRCAGHLA